MILYNISLSSSQSAGFPNKVTVSCCNTSSVNVLACHAESSTSLDLVSMIIKCGISLGFYELEKAPSYSWFAKGYVCNAFWQMLFIKCFLHPLIRVYTLVHYINWFLNVKTDIYAWNKSHLTVIYSFLHCYVKLANILLRNFSSVPMRDIGL